MRTEVYKSHFCLFFISIVGKVNPTFIYWIQNDTSLENQAISDRLTCLSFGYKTHAYLRCGKTTFYEDCQDHLEMSFYESIDLWIMNSMYIKCHKLC